MKNLIIILFSVFLITACTSSIRFSSELTQSSDIQKSAFRGLASYYSDKFEGRLTSSGEVFNQKNFTAAHNSLPFGTMVEVQNLSNKRKVVVRINDRGPFVNGRIIDLSKSAAEALDMINAGVVEVEIRLISD